MVRRVRCGRLHIIGSVECRSELVSTSRFSIMYKDWSGACEYIVGVVGVGSEVVDLLEGGPGPDGGDLDVGAGAGAEPIAGV